MSKKFAKTKKRRDTKNSKRRSRVIKNVLCVSSNLVGGGKATVIIGRSLQEGKNLLLENIEVEPRQGHKYIIIRGKDGQGRLWVVEFCPKQESGWATVQ